MQGHQRRRRRRRMGDMEIQPFFITFHLTYWVGHAGASEEVDGDMQILVYHFILSHAGTSEEGDGGYVDSTNFITFHLTYWVGYHAGASEENEDWG
jgi:hypothetical protein